MNEEACATTKSQWTNTSLITNKIQFSMTFFFSLFEYLLKRILIMNQSDSCQSQANWSVSVQRAWIQLHVEDNDLELTLTSCILKSK